jgi:hypothetical protein
MCLCTWQLSALDLAEKRKKEKAGRVIAELLRKTSGLEKVTEDVAADDDDTFEAQSPKDPEWQKVCHTNPFRMVAL